MAFLVAVFGANHTEFAGYAVYNGDLVLRTRRTNRKLTVVKIRQKTGLQFCLRLRLVRNRHGGAAFRNSGILARFDVNHSIVDRHFLNGTAIRVAGFSFGVGGHRAVHRNGNRHQNAHNHNHNHQFHKGEALFILKKCLVHFSFPLILQHCSERKSRMFRTVQVLYSFISVLSTLFLHIFGKYF